MNWTFPEWAKWTGDPFYNLYSHIEPGTVGHYSSAGFWRLGQALTALWGRDLKDVLAEKIFRKMGKKREGLEARGAAVPSSPRTNAQW